ncbi:hypothetical protein ACJMK2_031477 [Sinanodonta woodiana]|uniref:Uncharacterized protein n=1 Tax=Sinanodonta woodiana TaxID=1069815 RepID=A0ABD3X109_SINWO
MAQDVIYIYVKIVMHAAYTQEIGRAGRDGSRTQAILYYNATDLAQRYVDKAIKDFFKSQISAEDCFYQGTLM